MKKALLAGVTAVALTFAAGAAQAGLSIVGGTAGVIPGSAGPEPGTPGTNEALGPLGFANPLAGIFGGQIAATAAGTITYSYHGAEIGAGTTNTFSFPGDSFSAVGSMNSFSVPGTDSGSVVVGAPGNLTFSFGTTLGGGQSVANGSNGTEVAGTPLMNFFAYQASATQIWLFLDDTGGQRRGGGSPPDDDNHDDMVIKVTWSATPIPEPTTLALMGAGLLGLGVAARRRRKV